MHQSGDWQKIYKERTVSAGQALTVISSGSRIFVAAGCGRSQILIDELMKLAGKVADIEILHLKTIGIAPYIDAEYKDRFRHNALFIGSNVLEAVSNGRADYTPMDKYQIVKLFKSGRIQLNAALIQVTPPNELGYVSMGITVGISKTAAECADYVIAQVNPNLPYTLGDSFLHVSEIDAFVYSETPIIEAPTLEGNAITDKIARNCAKLIEDGATIHLGYNPTSFALVKYLHDRHDLGVHTDILTAPIIELIQSGVVNNFRKSINANKTVTSLCYGNKETYEFIHNNPQIEFRPTEYVSDPVVIAQHERMIAINEAYKVDLSGLVCAKFVGPRFGCGFMWGATHAKHGKSIVTLPSTTEDEKESNIVMSLEPNLGLSMSTNREDIQFVITEYGIATLYGKSIRERALALIHIAHPKFRESLMQSAKEHKYVHADQLLSFDAIYPDHLERWHTLDDGMSIFVRPARPTDERIVQSFVYRLSDKSIRYRFHGTQQTMHHHNVQQFVNVDYNETITLLALLVSEQGNEEVIAMAQYLFYPSKNQAEVAFITADKYHSRGISSYLLKYLIKIARKKGIEKFFAEVLVNNHQMIKVFHKSGVPLNSILEDRVYNITLDLTAEE